MAKKKKSSKSNSHVEMIHFRPGRELGELISELAKESQISRGEAAKRMTGLAIRGLDSEIYQYAEELTQYLYGAASFDEACHHIAVAIHKSAADAGIEPQDMHREDQLHHVRELLEHHRIISGVTEKAKEQRISIKLIRDTE